MNTYTSKTGYVRYLPTGEVSQAENYEDTTKEEYEKYIKETENNGNGQETK